MKKEVKKEWFLDRYCGQKFAAHVTDGKLTEFFCEREHRDACVGNVYKGKVANVLAGMNAAFINCGLARNCYLSMDEFYTDCKKYDGVLGERSASALDLQVGDEIIVQITQPPRGNKGAKVTTQLSFVGKTIIYLPNTDFLGISRKITDEAMREKLLAQTEKMRKSKSEGFILRTQGALASQRQLSHEASYLKTLYKEMLKLSQNAPVGTLLYEDEDLPVRIMRDSYGEEVSTIHVGDKALYQRLSKLIKLRKDFSSKQLVLYEGERQMMEEYGITKLIYNATNPVVHLTNGGSLVIEHTEAMTVIDVNSASYVGGENLEETVFAVNLAAAEEIARQVRLRNIGGIIVVDFIDMTNEKHKTAVTEALKGFLAQDTAKCNVLPMSELCLTQFTRKRVGNTVLSYLVKPCPHCQGKGHVREDIFVVTRIRAQILDRFAEGYVAAVVDLNENIMRKILRESLFAEELKGIWANKRVYFIPHKTYKEECFSVRGERDRVLTLPDKAQILY